MEILKNKKGITLIALIVTIVVILILSGAIISTIFTDNGIIANASKSKTKSYLSRIKEEYKLYLNSKLIEGDYAPDTLFADDSIIRYNGERAGNGIKEICQTIEKGDEKTFEIIRGKIYFISQDKVKIEIARQLGFSINPYDIVDGVLKASEMNLFLTDVDGNLDLSEYEGKIKKLENINIDNFLEVLMKIGLSAYSSNWVIWKFIKNIVFVMFFCHLSISCLV